MPYLNAYQKRRAQRKLVRTAYTRSNAELKQLEIHAIMCGYEQAFKEFYGRTIKVTYKHGWYYVGTIKVRQTILINMTNCLLAKVHERDHNYEEV